MKSRFRDCLVQWIVSAAIRPLFAGIRSLVPVVVAAMLTSCGGGGNTETALPVEAMPDTGAALPNDAHPYLKEAYDLLSDDSAGSASFDSDKLAAESAYEGMQSEAELHRDTAGRVLTAVVKGIPAGFDYPSQEFQSDHTTQHLGILSEVVDLMQIHLFETKYKIEYSYPGDENVAFSYDLETCTSGSGTAHVAASRISSQATVDDIQSQIIGELAIFMDFNDCGYEGKTIDGLVRVHSEIDGENQIPAVFAFDNSSVQVRDQYFNVSGVISETDHCIGHMATEATLLVQHTASGAQTLYQDFHWFVDDTENALCGVVKNYPWNAVTGVLKLSDIGAVSVDTSTALLLSSNPIAAFNSYFSEPSFNEVEIGDGGEIRITGASQSSLTYAVMAPRVSANGLGEELPFVVSVLDTVESDQPTEFSTSSSAFNSGILHNLADSDNDGLHDSWEIYHSLNPHDPRDATVAKTNTDITPADAYSIGSDLGGKDFYVPYTDIGISLDIETTFSADSNSMELAAVVSGQMSSSTYEPLVKQVDLVLEGNAEWDYAMAPLPCNKSQNFKTISCEYEISYNNDGVYGFEIPPIPILVDEDAQIAVTATLDAAARDKNKSDNTANDEAAFFVVPPVDYQIDVVGHTAGNTVDISNLTAKILQTNDVRLSDVEIEVKPSDGMKVIDAELLSTGAQALVSRCSIGLFVTCSMGDVQPGDELSLTVDYVLIEDEDQQIEWSVKTDTPEINHEDNRARTLISAVSSVSGIQSMIDAAEADATLTLPAGRYAGTLDFKGKSVNIIGAEGDSRTVLESHDVDNPILINGGGYITVSNMVFKTTGAPIVEDFFHNLTIENSLIVPLENRPHTLKTLIDSDSYRLLNNTIRGFGLGAGNKCYSLVHQHEEQTYTGMEIYLERNLILNNNCDQLILSNSHIYTVVHHTLNNNTFINAPTLLRVSDVSNRFDPIKIVNNIMMDIDELIDIPGNAYQTGFGGARTPRFYSSRNLLWRSEREALVTGELLSREGVSFGKTDFNMDPLFRDADNEDYRLAFNSPVIDRGVQPTEYIWVAESSADLLIQPSETIKIQPIDGDFDGQSLFDLGAFEYDPEVGL